MVNRLKLNLESIIDILHICLYKNMCHEIDIKILIPIYELKYHGTIIIIYRQVLLKLDLDIKKCREQGYNGALVNELILF